MLKRHRAALEAAAQLLLEKETLSGAELEEILDRHPPIEAANGASEVKVHPVKTQAQCME